MAITQQRAGNIALRTLLAGTKLSPTEIEERFAQAISPTYWEELIPDLSVNGRDDSTLAESQPIGKQLQEQLLKSISRSGYFQTPNPIIARDTLDRMRDGVAILRREGWPEVFGFVYKEFWQIMRTPSLVNLLAAALGAGYSPLPHVVVHYITPGASGWRPHVDFSDRADRFTVWVALNDVELDGGCMYLIPRDRISASLQQQFINSKDVTHKEVQSLLHGSRALPVRAGSFLGWDHDVIHWGASCSINAEPRISMSVVFLRENIAPLADEVPLLDQRSVPDFAQRLFAIAKALTYYDVHVLALSRFGDLAARLVAEVKKTALNA